MRRLKNAPTITRRHFSVNGLADTSRCPGQPGGLDAQPLAARLVPVSYNAASAALGTPSAETPGGRKRCVGDE